MPENEELTDDLQFQVEESPSLEIDDPEEDETEVGDDSPEIPTPDEEEDDDALDAAAELRLIKRGKYPRNHAEAPTSPAEAEELPDPVYDPQGFYERVKADIRAEMDGANEPMLRPQLSGRVEANIKDFMEAFGSDLPDEAYEALREEAKAMPIAQLRNAADPAFAAQIAREVIKNFKPVPKAAAPKPRPIGASVTSGVHAANPSPKSIELKGEDADAWREWSGTFGDSPDTRKRFLKAIGRSK